MTGFGRGEMVAGGWRFAIELSSVNRKQGEIVVSLPREWQAHEAALRQQIGERVARGRVVVNVAVERARGPRERLRVDLDLARAYVAALGQIAKAVGSKVDLEATDLLRAPGVFTVEENVPQGPEVGPALERAARRALEVFDKTRLAEGAALRKDLESRLKELRSIHKKVAARAPQVVTHHRNALRRRLDEAGLPLPLDDERLVREIALFAERSDISEELARLGSHLDQFAATLRGGEPAGRPLDFLCQELHRELNTMSSKAADAGIAHLVVAGKSAVEKLREQVQNLE
ncbi:MAG: YicC/YloC family endoribonuclease [Verrucomicrobiales bacterium]